MIVAMSENTVTIDADIAKRLDALAEPQGLTREKIVAEALRSYVDFQEREIEEIEKGIRALERGEKISHEDMMAELRELIAAKTRPAAE